MTDVEIEKLISLAALSPTAFNIQNWRFLVVSDPKIRQEIRNASFNQAQVTDASVLIVLCADLDSWKKDPGRYWEDVDEDTQDILVPMIKSYYQEREQVQRDEAMRSCGIAAQTLMLAAQEFGYSSNAMDGFDFDKVGEIINLPFDYVITMFVTIGRPLTDPWPRSGQLPLSEILIENSF